VVLSVRPHDFFERHGNDLHCVIPISFPQAALGAEFEIPGIDGPINSRFPKARRAARNCASAAAAFLTSTTRARRSDGQGAGADSAQAEPRPARLVSKLAESLTVDNKPTSPGLLGDKMKDLFN
jgi:molecular chaperone DnaJ